MSTRIIITLSGLDDQKYLADLFLSWLDVNQVYYEENQADQDLPFIDDLTNRTSIESDYDF